MTDDYWFWQRYDALLYKEHKEGHPESDARECQWCASEAEDKQTQSKGQKLF